MRIAWASEPGKQRACPGLHLQNWRQGSVQRLTRRGRLKESQKWGKTALVEGRRLPLAQRAAMEWETGQGASFPGDELIRPLPLSDPRGRGLYVCVCVCARTCFAFFKKKKNLFWSIVSVQCCVCFRCTKVDQLYVCITLPTEVMATVFPAVMYGCESWTIKKAECQRVDAFELWCWRRLLRVPWTARRSNQSILKKKKKKSTLNIIRRTDAEAEAPILWPPDVKS